MNKNLLIGLLVASVLASAWWWFHRSESHPQIGSGSVAGEKSTSLPAVKSADTSVPSEPSTFSSSTATHTNPIPATQVNSKNTKAPEPLDETMNAKLKLADLGFSTNADTIPQIISYITNSDAEVRALAIETIKQAGNHDTVPLLEKIVQTTDDETLKAQLTQAELFLTIPNLNESMPVIPDFSQRPPRPANYVPGPAPQRPPSNPKKD